MIQAGDLVEFQFYGDDLTWGGMKGKLWVQCKIDKCFGNKSWFGLFPASNQTFLEKRRSDYKAFLVKHISGSDSYRSSFRFDSRFLYYPHVKDDVKKTGLTSHPFFNLSVSDKLKKVKKG